MLQSIRPASVESKTLYYLSIHTEFSQLHSAYVASRIQIHNLQNDRTFKDMTLTSSLIIWFFFSPGATTPIGGCILQPSSGL